MVVIAFRKGKYHLSRNIIKYTKRLAHKYLVEHELSGTYVASLLGYQSSSQFFTAFKSWFAMTPKCYKKMYS